MRFLRNSPEFEKDKPVKMCICTMQVHSAAPVVHPVLRAGKGDGAPAHAPHVLRVPHVCRSLQDGEPAHGGRVLAGGSSHQAGRQLVGRTPAAVSRLV